MIELFALSADNSSVLSAIWLTLARKQVGVIAFVGLASGFSRFFDAFSRLGDLLVPVSTAFATEMFFHGWRSLK